MSGPFIIAKGAPLTPTPPTHSQVIQSVTQIHSGEWLKETVWRCDLCLAVSARHPGECAEHREGGDPHLRALRPCPWLIRPICEDST